MPGSTILRLTDPYEYQTAVGHRADQRSIITAAGSYRSELTLVNLHRLGVQHGRVSLPRIVRGVINENLCSIAFSSAARVTVNGIQVPESYIIFGCPGAETVMSASADDAWGGLTLSPETLVAASQALIGYEITLPKAAQLVCTPPPLMARLHNLHKAATQLAATAPDILAHPEVARAIEQELLRVLIACLTDSTIKRTNPNRQRVMHRFHQMVEANQDESLYIAEICAAIGVPERTLHHACKDYLRMSPHRYLRLRRMNLVRRALALADPEEKSVTGIANDYGFAELGRFAVEYRAMYGESPSATLWRTPHAS